ncbi:class I SAM-dependent methyltransferase [Brevibacillus daliensis]|uniref:class I SAM-dependent methyltransferase n=1 Tax=Brevibacillus daliensis TaxID=2892995 RepID=UPI001E442711|nr:class I SAM-dependent methyltransferase [Brevibacillus daliensis]
MKQNLFDNPDFFRDFQHNRLSGESENDLIEQPALRSCLPPLKGLKVLDLGCGGGQFARYCMDQGALAVTGVDLSKNMLEYAHTHNDLAGITYIHGALEDIELPTNYYDLIVSSLVMDYVRDYESVVKKITQALSDRGYFVYSTLHPHITARKLVEGWVRDEKGNKHYWPLDNYLEDGRREMYLVKDQKATFYHRSMSTAVNTLIKAGLMLHEIIEPTCTPEGLLRQPHQISEIRRPTFLILKTQKVYLTKE